MTDQIIIDRAIEAYSNTESALGPEDVGNSEAYFEATEVLECWFVEWFDENEATGREQEAPLHQARSFAEQWIAHLDQARDIEETNANLSMASEFI